ncbi:hypothetical protein [Williamwhitmania taraxaci]|uniref:Filamentous hemagglutinin n=1 Tax=Williamwhitmania taraxaci TaxID=1640674 RepID=A0A1G6TZC8_9BACT|nr:hypothetical protein [Williamwhitmania taraxaci]SDD34421.1 hypothetical protein SAMN05216323_11443 [Williamwhitmania taraxaci]
MRFFFQIFLFLFTWFNLGATPVFSKVALPSVVVSFPKAENQNQESELKIGVSNFARSGISENSFSENAILWESSVLENRAHEVNVWDVKEAGKLLDNALIAELKATLGNKVDVKKLIGLVKNPEGKIVWLDKGVTNAEAIALGRKKGAGFAHVLEKHATDFLNKGITEADLPEFLLKAAKENNIVKTTGSTSRAVFETTFKGVKQRVTITIGDNGYIVGANPISF